VGHGEACKHSEFLVVMQAGTFGMCCKCRENKLKQQGEREGYCHSCFWSALAMVLRH
jgi:hypothetical protein